jgi:hypothetical protein
MEILPQEDRPDDGVAKAVQSYLLYVALPGWTIPGFADWLCHRIAKIEHTSGTHESLTHALMMTSVGIPTAMALLFEVNASTIAVAAGGCAIHEAIVLWDVAYAAPRREVSNTEQHIHSFLEVLPFMSLAFLACLHWDQAAALLRLGDRTPDFSVQFKKRPLSPLYLAGIGAIVTAFIGIPYAEELVRCYRVDGTFKPHAT